MASFPGMNCLSPWFLHFILQYRQIVYGNFFVNYQLIYSVPCYGHWKEEGENLFVAFLYTSRLTRGTLWEWHLTISDMIRQSHGEFSVIEANLARESDSFNLVRNKSWSVTTALWCWRAISKILKSSFHSLQNYSILYGWCSCRRP